MTKAPTTTETPKPEEVHYTAKVQSPQNTIEAAQYWINEAHKAMLYELCEEINSGQHQVGSNWWNAQVHRRALEMIEADDTMRPAYRTKIHQTIEDEALFSYAGYESSEEWFASEASLRKGGQASDYGFWASILIPWCKANRVFKSSQEADRWFFTPVNSDGSSRMAPLRDATPDLRDIVERGVYDLDPAEKRTIVSNILADVADPELSRTEKRAKLNSVREAKMTIQIYKNGDGRWHVAGDLTEGQKERLEKDLKFSAVIEVVESPL
jgi:hypothetical protein